MFYKHMMKRLPLKIRQGMSLALLAVPAFAGAAPASDNADASVFTTAVTVMTDKGAVRGEAKTNHRQFLGLPYASAAGLHHNRYNPGAACEMPVPLATSAYRFSSESRVRKTAYT